MKYCRQIIFVLTLLLIPVLFCACDQQEYSIVFEADGVTVGSFTAEEGKEIAFPADPSKEGYTFGGWTTDNGTNENQFVSTLMPRENLTLYALWIPVVPAASYTLSFDSNGGSPVSGITAIRGQAIFAPAPPVKEYFSFGGWYRDNGTFAEKYQFSFMPAKNLTVYARWLGPNSAVELLWASHFALFKEIWKDIYTIIASYVDFVDIGSGLAPYVDFVDIGSGYNDAFTAKNGIPWFYEYTLSNAAAMDEYLTSRKSKISQFSDLEFKQIPDTDFFASELLGLYDILSDNTICIEGTYYNKEKTTLIRADTDIETFQIPDSVTNIGYMAFAECQALKTVSIPNSVINIGKYAFMYCKALQSISLPDSLRNIGTSAFYSCSSLTHIFIPNGVTKIDEEAFENCSSLVTVTIPSSVTEIGERAFAICKRLTLYAEPFSKPSGWKYNWNYWNVPEGNVIWRAVKKTYHFETNGGSVCESVSAVVLTELPIPEREGYTFVGWYCNENYTGSPIASPYYTTAETTLYAKWE